MKQQLIFFVAILCSSLSLWSAEYHAISIASKEELMQRIKQLPPEPADFLATIRFARFFGSIHTKPIFAKHFSAKDSAIYAIPLILETYIQSFWIGTESIYDNNAVEADKETYDALVERNKISMYYVLLKDHPDLLAVIPEYQALQDNLIKQADGILF